MTTTPPDPTLEPTPEEDEVGGDLAAAPTGSRPTHAPQRPVWVLVSVWVVVTIVSLVLVLYALEPVFQARRQSALMADYTAEIDQASNQLSGLPTGTVAMAPSSGAPVAIIEAPDVKLQQVAVEGVEPQQTAAGPGHVPGTAGPGQPGNSVMVGRRGMYGAPFGEISSLRVGAAILVTTTEGQSVYRVSGVYRTQLVEPTSAETASQSALPSAIDTDTAEAATDDPAAGPKVDVNVVYGKTKDDRLTLVTSNSVLPWNSSDATVVIAKMDGQPFRPTPQNGRTSGDNGLSGDSSSWPKLLLAVQAFGLTVVATVLLYRRSSVRVAWLLTIPPIIAFTILAAESLSSLLPAWA